MTTMVCLGVWLCTLWHSSPFIVLIGTGICLVFLSKGVEFFGNLIPQLALKGALIFVAVVLFAFGSTAILFGVVLTALDWLS